MHSATTLEGRVCVVTGAARGIGRAVAERLLAAGARVVLSDRDEEELGRTHQEFARASSIAVTADVTSGASMAYLAGEAERRLGPIDVWINNAGLARHRAIADYSEDEIDSMLAVNLKGTILGSQAALRTMAPSWTYRQHHLDCRPPRDPERDGLLRNQVGRPRLHAGPARRGRTVQHSCVGRSPRRRRYGLLATRPSGTGHAARHLPATPPGRRRRGRFVDDGR